MAGKRRVAILGGGVGALTTAFWLTSEPKWNERFEITIYQLGWRLGGKGASSRDESHGQRIQEHGLHVWFGWYQNAFRTIRACYKELDRPPGAPLRTVDEAFHARTNVRILEQRPHDTWEPLDFDMPLNPGVVGTHEPDVRFWPVVVRILETLVTVAGRWADHEAPPKGILGRACNIVERIKAVLGLADWLLLDAALQLARKIHAGTAPHSEQHHQKLQAHLHGFRGYLQRIFEHDHSDPVVRHLIMLTDLGVSVVAGLLADDVRSKGLGAIDSEELTPWLRRHGASKMLLESSLLRSLYDGWFAYRDGVADNAHRDIAAGVGVGCIIREFAMYEGPLLYLMAAGMGDVVVTPIYQLLVKRGVKFEFFSDVKKLRLSEDKTRIAAIEIARQVETTGDVYDPLITVKGLPSWPATPRYEQLAQGEELKRQKIDLESHWTTWKPVKTLTLQYETDFDDVVLGISLGGLRELCSELIDARSEWRQMIERIPTVPTQSMQVWFDKDFAELGWKGPPRPSVGVPEPFSVWADMSHTLVREDWPATQPKSVVYLCGPLDQRSFRDGDDLPAHAKSCVRANSIEWLERYAGWVWPGVGDPRTKKILWERMFCSSNVQGEDRIDQQFLRANIDPTERYVITPSGTPKYRLASDASGFSNLWLAGDWTRTAVSAGCVEAATMSGMAASRAIAGYPSRIWCEDFLRG